MFRAAAERAMRASLALPHGGYADQRGTVEQRRILADWLRRSRVALSEDDLILSVGVQHGVHLAFLDLKDTSSLIATERSEEHTSELQSLMRISYAVFCLKKTKNTKQNN